MTLKQLAERMGAPTKLLDFELEMPCKVCRLMGGDEKPCGGTRCCEVKVKIRVAEE